MLNNKSLFLNLILFVSFVALLSAFFIEYVLGHQPCNLCILERIPYVIAIVIILLNYKFSQFEKIFLVLLVIVFLTATILSVYHFGIEQGFIEESLVCDLKNGSEATSKEEILKQLQEQKVSCKDVTFKIFGLSLTTYNIVISILITINALKIYLNYAKSK
ncbi:MAG: disulfide bond formation protein B [Proteobacteria bacterium]|jgi:disulfide bond formation protein DsbB|nr:MAG: disulfide bond formation protein B [Pseudomonadota bacterium]|tara:strand:- start:349 stop:831 length:483 start_codon:yes stop_codon:yes gene_type:complete